MRSLISSRVLRVHVAALVAVALIIGSAATVAAKPRQSHLRSHATFGLGADDHDRSDRHPGTGSGVRQRRRDGHLRGRLDVYERLDLHPPERSGRLRDVHIDLHGHAAGRPLEGGQRQSVHARQLDRKGLCASHEERPADPGRGLADDHARAPASPCGSRTRASSPARPAAAPSSRSRSPARWGRRASRRPSP